MSEGGGIVLFFLGLLFGVGVGWWSESRVHRPHCFCEGCKKWRESRRKEGKEPEAE